MSGLVVLPSVPLEVHGDGFPVAPLASLDTLWFQVSGTICNLKCNHCFIACSPKNHRHEMLTYEVVVRYLEEAKALGVREYYFTGGEPFMNRDMLSILERTLQQGPASVLTNGLLIKDRTAERLRKLSDGTPYSLDLRISLDGWDAETNDPIRGEGTFDRILAGVAALARFGLSPVLTVTEACAEAQTRHGRTRFLAFLREIGLTRPRLKILPLLRMGAEEGRERGYHPWETLAGARLLPEELEALQCTSCRMVTSRGVYVCPILIEREAARMGQTLQESLRPFSLAHSACYTCHTDGLRCAT